ncbi:MAG: efflux RND transporter periplasmic adaptor subunit [Burkholderiaceae bacterium]
MATKVIYSVVAVLGIAAASGAAWWYQTKAPSTAASMAANTEAGGASGAAGVPQSKGVTGSSNATASPAAARLPSVESAKVEVMKLTDDTQTVGSLKSRQGVTLRPEVSGRITQLNFRDGERVKKGQLLVQFDDQLQIAQVKQSQAELSIALANHKRNQDLVAQNFISKRSVDESAANLEVAQAKLVLSQATAARLKITAPFDGIAGIRTVNVGDYLKDGGDIVNIEDIAAVFVDFRLPERFQAKVKKGQIAQVDMDALPGRKFTAMIQAIDPLVDANGRSIGVRACIDNREGQLRPGMFARVNAVFGERDKARVIPEEAIVPLAGKQFVIKLVDAASAADKDSKTTQRIEVKVGIRRPGRVEILEGLNEGDEVVVAGQQRIQKDGTVVKVMNLPRPGERATASGPVVAAVAIPKAETDAKKPNPNPAAKALPGPNPCLEAKSAGRA